MRLPSGRMCSVVRGEDGKFISSVYPASDEAEVVNILEEWLSVNPQHPALAFAQAFIALRKEKI